MSCDGRGAQRPGLRCRQHQPASRATVPGALGLRPARQSAPFTWSFGNSCQPAGALATAGYGTALGVLRALKESGSHFEVFVNETRPFLQGSRLTAWELKKEKIPATLITDSMAGYLMQKGKVDAVVVGCDRVAANGDVANKIGTYTIAVLAKRHGIPFYVAGPTSSIDMNCASGKDIPI